MSNRLDTRFVSIFSALHKEWDKSDRLIANKCKCRMEHVRFIRNAIKYDKEAVYQIYSMILNDDPSAIDLFHPIHYGDDIEVHALAHPSGLLYSLKMKTISLGTIDINGYLSINVNYTKDGIIYRRSFRYHRLVLSAFVENDDPEHKTQVNHIDGDKTNNAISNLEWCTSQENCDHSVRMGLQPVGEDSYQTIYSKSQIEKVCELLQDGIYSPKRIEILTGVNRKAVQSIRTGKKWKSVSKDYTFPESKFDSLGRYINANGEAVGEIIRVQPDQHKYTDEQIDLACKMKVDRKRLAYISDATGVGIRTIVKLGGSEDSYKHISDKYTFPSITNNDRRWFTDKEIERACELLMDPNNTIEDVCKLSGVSRRTIRRFHGPTDPYPEITCKYEFPKQRMGLRGRLIDTVYQ